MTAALRQLAYGYTPDALYKYLQMSKRVVRESLRNFCRCIIDLYASVYLREPTLHDINRLYESHERIHGLMRKQASARKDVERTFGILQGRWHILQQPARSYEVNIMRQLMYTCIVLHNIIIEDDGYNLAENDWAVEPVQHIQRTLMDRCDARARRTRELRDREVHKGIRSNLVEHLWDLRDDL